MTTKEKLNQAVKASAQVHQLIREATIKLQSNDIHYNGYGVLMSPYFAGADVSYAIASLQKALALIDKTAWLTDSDYDRL